MDLEEIKKLIKYPVTIEHGYYYDADGNMIAQVRGWGRLQYLPEPEKKQDGIGQFIADAINEKLTRDDRAARKVIYLAKATAHFDTPEIRKQAVEKFDKANPIK